MSEEHEGLPEVAEDPRSDDELLEAAAVAEGEPAAERSGDEDLVDGAAPPDAAAERDEYLEALQRVKAEFDNFRRRSAKERLELIERANAGLVERLLPVLDACDAALAHGASDVEPIHKSLVEVLEREGLERMTPEGQPFDPTRHEAVVHEPGGGEGEATVVECLRPGYLWKGQVLRAAMVKVRG
jgi:molecular chaperone GrpE